MQIKESHPSPQAKALADSDLHSSPWFLSSMVSTLQSPLLLLDFQLPALERVSWWEGPSPAIFTVILNKQLAVRRLVLNSLGTFFPPS